MILLSSLLFELTDLIFVKNVSVATVGQMLLYKIPGMVVLTLPIAVLFSGLLALGRLSQDSEITILRSCGLPFRRIVVAVVAAGLLVSVATYLANEIVVPWSNHQFERILRRIIYEEGLPAVQENVFFRGGEGRYFYIHRVLPRSREIENVMVYEVGSGRYPRLITAQNGVYQDYNWVLQNGVVREIDEDGFVSFETQFERMEIISEQQADVYIGNQKTTDEMNRQELREHIERFQRGGLTVNSFVIDFHLKLAMPMASFIFALFGSPLALRSRGGRSFGVAVSLIITFCYYVLTSVSRSLGVNGIFPPLLAAWFTNGVFFLAGMWLIIRADELR